MIRFYQKINVLMNKKRILVPRRGLEPPQVAPQVPETCVSTNFTTSARGGVKSTEVLACCQLRHF